MIALLQRVSEASAEGQNENAVRIGAGLLALVCAVHGDSAHSAARLAGKVARLRIFADGNDKMNLSVLDTKGSCLAVSQFTLAADVSRGNRPSFTAAAEPDKARNLFDKFCAELAALGVPVKRGFFGTHMRVGLINDGPVTLLLSTR